VIAVDWIIFDPNTFVFSGAVMQVHTVEIPKGKSTLRSSECPGNLLVIETGSEEWCYPDLLSVLILSTEIWLF